MASTLECYWRKHNRNNMIGSWERDEENGLYMQWIRSYFQQPIRDRPIIVIGTHPDTGEERSLRCMADSNEKITGITGITFGESRIEIVWGYSHQILERYP